MQERTLENLYKTLMTATGGEKLLSKKREPRFSNLVFEEPKTPEEKIDVILFDYLDFDSEDMTTIEYFKLSEVDRAKQQYLSAKKKIDNLKTSLSQVEEKLQPLKDKQAEILEMIMKKGFSEELQKRGQELQEQKDIYSYLQELLKGYEENLIEDLKSFESQYQDKFRKIFGERLRQARNAKKMTLEELAASIGARRVTLNLYELGNSDPSAFTLYRLCKVLGVTADFLLNLSETEKGE